MTASIVAFPRPRPAIRDWTNEELAELYRVVDLLDQAGLRVEPHMGLSDEGEPWFIFCRADTDDVLVHFAYIDGQFIAASPALDETYRGANFRQIIDELIRSQPLMVPPPKKGGSKLFMHPGAVLAAFVATAFAQTEMNDWNLAVPIETELPDSGVQAQPEKAGVMQVLQAMLKSNAGDAKAAESEKINTQPISMASVIAIAMGATTSQAAPASTSLELLQQSRADADAEPSSRSTSSSSPAHDPADEQFEAPVTGMGDKSRVATPEDAEVVAAKDDASNFVIDAFARSGDRAPTIQVGDAPVAPVNANEFSDGGKPTLVVTAFAPQAVPAADVRKASVIEAPKALVEELKAAVLTDISPEMISSLFAVRVEYSSDPSLVVRVNDPDPLPLPSAPAPKVPPESVVETLLSFVFSDDNRISPEMQPSQFLAAALDALALKHPDGPLKLVVFSSDDLAYEIFPFVPGILFVEEKHISPSSITEGAPIDLALASGGSMTLVGIIEIAQAI